MAVLRWFAITLGFIFAAFACPGHDSDLNISKHYIDRRWFSVQRLEGEGADRVVGPWPLREVAGEQEPVYHIPYCYKTEYDFDFLSFVFQQAIDKWHAALSGYSSLQFVPADPDDPKNICSQDAVSGEAVTLTDVTHTSNAVSRSILGYIKGREHYLMFGRTWSAGNIVKPYDVRSMAHELGEALLGHVLGLGHEHQRPDAPRSIAFLCQNLFDYERAVDNLNNKKKGMYREGDTLEDLCTSKLVARRYGFSAVSFIPWLESNALGHLVNNQALDIESIMLYDSYTGTKFEHSESEINWPNGAVLVRIKPGTDGSKISDWQRVYCGGGKPDDEFGTWKISQADITRVAALYPCREGSQCVIQ